MHNPESALENEMHKILWDFEIKTHHFISARRQGLPIVNNKKKENLPNCGLCRSGRPQGKTERKWKEREVPRSYKTTEKIWNMKVTVIPIGSSALGTVTKGLVQGLENSEIRGWEEAIQTTALLRSARYWEESRRLEETCCHWDSSKKPTVKASVKNSQKSKMIN